ncbi:MAG: AAA family ATPase [Candidatus Obscuribacterales bacterium]|nr:AAA family ATPase [Candidatus Obscuribacterales bacterium]
MNTSESIKLVLRLSARAAIKRRHAEIEIDHVMLTLLRMATFTETDIKNLKLETDEVLMADEVRELRREFQQRGIEPTEFRQRLSDLLGLGNFIYSGGGLHRTANCRQMFVRAAELAQVPKQAFRAVHLLVAAFAAPTPLLSRLMSGPQLATAPSPKKIASENDFFDLPESAKRKVPAIAGLTGSRGDDGRLVKLTRTLRNLKARLLSNIFAQEHAIEAFVDGLFNAEITSSVDDERRAPRAVFVFAGPPGVGKTFLAEFGAEALDRPFRRFDMSAYAGIYQGENLVGLEHNTRPGLLTGFVDKNPEAILLFDEIEKAHLNTIQYFLQVLDAGTLDDKHLNRSVSFRETTLVFTTNVGRKLYQNPDRSGVHKTNAAFHRRTIIDALFSEVNPATLEPYLPEAICSRFATGYPVLFNHLGVNDLTKLAASEADRTAGLLSRELGKQINLDPLLPLLLVMKEGNSDARNLKAQTAMFIKNEIFKVTRLFADDRLADAIGDINTIQFELDAAYAFTDPQLASLLEPPEKPRVLLIGTNSLADWLRKTVLDVDWLHAADAEDAMARLADNPPDFVLIDLWLEAEHSKSDSKGITIAHFDQTPPAARGLERGQQLLRKLHERVPGLPVVLLLRDPAGQKSANDELLSACIRAGGARETLSCIIDEDSSTLEQFRRDLISLAGRLAREERARLMARQRKVLVFDTAPRMDEDGKVLRIRLRNLRFSRAVAAGDAGELIGDVERPTTKFDDVIGADSAKEELRFFIDYLKNPRRFSALGLKPPKGLLLYGPPGTGKTMLARAMAGETELAYLAATATSFVTVWQGSGPENVRKLFERARRYAPAILFIDEIDAIGKIRGGSLSSGHAEEMALNALLTELDGFSEEQGDRPVFVLAATNFRVDAQEYETGGTVLDPALVRRFSRSILVELPDLAARHRFFTLRLAKGDNVKVSQQTIDLLAEKSVSMSIASLERVMEAAGRMAFRNGVELGDGLLIEALDTALDGEVKEWSPEFLEGTAWHEAGHTVMYWHSGWLSPEVSIVARANYGGGMRRAVEEIKRESRTHSELLAAIRTDLGGRVAEMLHFGDACGLTTGASSDLEHASYVARGIICRYGMDQTFGLGTMTDILNHPEAVGTPLYREVQLRVSAILKEQEALTRECLEQHKRELDAVATALLKKNRLLKSDLETIFAGSQKY